MRFVWFLALSLPVVSSIGQSLVLSGVVTDGETRRPLAHCNVAVVPGRQAGQTNGLGEFRIVIPEAAVATLLIFSYVGYKVDTLKIKSTGNSYFVSLVPDSHKLDEVLIAGISRTSLIRENPVSIVSVSLKKFESTSESNLIDALVKHVPGLNAVKTGPNISKPFIRGLGYNRVLTLYDGIRQEGQQWGDEHGIEVDTYHLERAEVIKGPASLMFGSDALAGVVSLFPAVYRERDGVLRGKWISEYQSNNGLAGTGVRIGYGLNRWTINAQGSYRRAGNYTNRIDDRVYNTGFEEKNGALMFGYSTAKGSSELRMTAYDNLQGIPDGSRDSLTRQFTRQVEEFPLDDIKNRPTVEESALNTYLLSPLHQRIQHYRTYMRHQYAVGAGEGEVVIGFQQNIRREYNHPQYVGQPGLYVRLNTLNYSAKYSAPEALPVQITVGVNGMLQQNKNKDATDFPIPDYHLLDAGSYVFAKWKYNQWVVSGGVRYDFRSLNGNDFYVRQNPVTGFSEQVHLPDTTGATLQFPALHKRYAGISWSLGGTFQFNEHFGLKANLAQGYRAPSITEVASHGLDPGAHIVYQGNRSFLPEFNLEEDLGVQGSFTDVAFSFGLFNNHVSNYIYLTQSVDSRGHPVILEGGNKVFQYQQSAARLYGIEAMLDIHPATIPGFDFSSGLSLTYGFNLTPTYHNTGVNGEFLPFIPPLKILSSVAEEFKLTSKAVPLVSIKVEMDYNAAQSRYLALNQTETMTPGYILWNAGLGFHIQFSRKSVVQLQVQVNNLLDRSYQSNLSRLKYFEYYAQSTSGYRGIYGMGRNICFKVIFPL